MARRPDTPCAGGCGKLLWSGRSALPAGKRTCQPCRREGRAPAASYKNRVFVCAYAPCGKEFTAYDRRGAPRKTCSRSCASHLKAASRRLKAEEAWRALGLDPAAMRATVHQRRIMSAKASSRRRRLRHAETWDGITDQEILERDGWRCGICRKRIGRKYEYPHPRSASIDHLVPIARGGDDVEANKQAAHLACNRAKRDDMSGGVQLQIPILEPRRVTEAVGASPIQRGGPKLCTCGRRSHGSEPCRKMSQPLRRERAAKALQLHEQGWMWKDIAVELDYASAAAAHGSAKNLRLSSLV